MGQHGAGAVHHGAGEAAGARQPGDLINYLALGQGLFYVLTGLWAVVDIDSFQRVTGLKTDRWLVKTVGVLVAVIGGVLALAGRRRSVSPELALLATGSAAGLAAIDVVYVARRTIAPIYLLDAAAELALIVGWLLALARERGHP